MAMGRYLNMDVQFNEVDVPPIWDLGNGNTMILNKHINAMVTRIGSRHVIDLNIDEYEPTYEQRYIDDRLALAQHYNNKAMGFLVENDHVQALRFLRKALHMEPSVSYLWNNLGSLYRRAGNLQAAELSYLAAIEADEDDLIALSNVTRLYEETDNPELAAYYEEQAREFRLQNPYFIYSMAQKAFVESDYESAQEHISDAIDLNNKEHRFYFLMGAIYQKTGDVNLANDNFNKALELSSDPKQQNRYRSKMNRLTAANT
ncbi:MAG: tetratricopeptide repeat protein [Gammaproteobacteria bacterium]|nr:tetratricopeptide repeat protein [Gammaproteobacteria bacterium]